MLMLFRYWERPLMKSHVFWPFLTHLPTNALDCAFGPISLKSTASKLFQMLQRPKNFHLLKQNMNKKSNELINRSSRRKRGMVSNPLFIIPEFFWKMQRKTWYSILGLDDEPLSTKLGMLRKIFTKQKVIISFY